MRYILTLLIISMFTISFSQNLDKKLYKKSNKIIETKDMLGCDVKVIKDKHGNKLYVEHTQGNITRFTIYRKNRKYKYGYIIHDEYLVMK